MEREKNWKRVATVSLALLLLCAGCQSAPRSWESSVDIGEGFRSGIEDALGDNGELMGHIDLDDVTLYVTAEAQEDGSYRLTVDETAMEQAVSDAMEALLEGMEEYKKSIGRALVGEWVHDVDLTDNFYKWLDESLDGISDYIELQNFVMEVHLSFGEDGTFRFFADEDALRQSLGTFREDITKGFEPYLKSLMEKEGIEKTPEEYVMEETGLTLEEFSERMADSCVRDVDTASELLTETVARTGVYEADGSELRLVVSGGKDSTLPYTIEGSTLTIIGMNSELMGDDVAFTKK